MNEIVSQPPRSFLTSLKQRQGENRPLPLVQLQKLRVLARREDIIRQAELAEVLLGVLERSMLEAFFE